MRQDACGQNHVDRHRELRLEPPASPRSRLEGVDVDRRLRERLAAARAPPRSEPVSDRPVEELKAQLPSIAQLPLHIGERLVDYGLRPLPSSTAAMGVRN
jgi:hypothetical protein